MLSRSVFKWITIPVTGNAFGTLSPGTTYWVGLLPGAIYNIPADSIGAYGIQWGGIEDSSPGVSAIPISPSVPKLYTAAEIGSKSTPYDVQFSCGKAASLTRVREQSNWASLPRYVLSVSSTTGRFEPFLTRPVIRHGIVLRGKLV